MLLKVRFILKLVGLNQKKNISLSENFVEGRLFAANLATPKGLELLDQLAEYYETRHSIVKLSSAIS